MGGDGLGVFSDDLASEVRGGYRELLEDQVGDHEATQRLVAEYADLDKDEEAVFWLALAATQWSLGRLEEQVCAKALDVIDSGRDLQRWQESGPRAIAARAGVLTALRGRLLSPQPPRKPVGRPWGYVTDLDPGAVLGFRAGDVVVLLRVARLMAGRLATAPVVQRLEWTRRSAPALWELEQAAPMLRTGLQGPNTDMLVTKHGRRDPDWSDAGFELLGHTAPRGTDAEVMPILYTSWGTLPRVLQVDVTEHTPRR